MKARIFQIDAFTNRLFAGNPAAVVILDVFPSDATLLAIAAENNLAETAFLVRRDGAYDLRWFTPKVEVPLCGHATLASAAVVMEHLEPTRTRVIFQSASGPLPVTRAGSSYVLDFPARPSEPIAAPGDLIRALHATPEEVLLNQFNYMAVLSSERQLRELDPDMAALSKLDRPGVIVTAKGNEKHDFVCRYFAPAKGILEDPVTGAAHCMLAPYWAKRLGKTEFHSFQASTRGGEIICRLPGDRVELQGECAFYLEGEIQVPTEL